MPISQLKQYYAQHYKVIKSSISNTLAASHIDTSTQKTTVCSTQMKALEAKQKREHLKHSRFINIFSYGPTWKWTKKSFFKYKKVLHVINSFLLPFFVEAECAFYEVVCIFHWYEVPWHMPHILYCVEGRQGKGQTLK